MDKINLEQAEKVFKENSIYINGFDVMTEQTAKKIFGEKICDNALNYDDNTIYGIYYNVFYSGKLRVEYFTRDGFMRLVTYNNIVMLNKDGESIKA